MQGVDKLQKEIDGKTLLNRCVGTVLQSCIERCILVISGGYTEHRYMEMGMPDLLVKIVEVTEPNLGMSASIQAGVKAAGQNCDSILIMLADMPDIQPHHIDKIVKSHDPKNGHKIVCPIDPSGQIGHPVLFDISYYNQLMELTGDRGAKSILQKEKDFVLKIPMDFSVTTDLDTPKDWAKWQAANLK